MKQPAVLYDALSGEQLKDYLLLRLRQLLEGDDRFSQNVTYHVIEEMEVGLRAICYSSYTQEVEVGLNVKLEGDGGELDVLELAHSESDLDKPDWVREQLREAETEEVKGTPV